MKSHAPFWLLFSALLMGQHRVSNAPCWAASGKESRSLCSERSSNLPQITQLVGQGSWSQQVPLTDLAAFQQESGNRQHTQLGV